MLASLLEYGNLGISDAAGRMGDNTGVEDGYVEQGQGFGRGEACGGGRRAPGGVQVWRQLLFKAERAGGRESYLWGWLRIGGHVRIGE